MARKKILDETPMEPLKLPAEQTEEIGALPESVTEATKTEQEQGLDAESTGEDSPKGEPEADGLPIDDGYPVGEISDIVSVELETGSEDEAIPPEAEVPYGEENNAGLPSDGEAQEHDYGRISEQETADYMADIAVKPEAQPEAAPESEPEQAAPSEQDAPVNERRAFFGQDFRELDRSLTPAQRQEWNSIYASYRGRSVMSGQVVGVDRVRIRTRDKNTGEMIWRRMYCAIVIPFRVRILIPESEMWLDGDERPGFVLRNIAGASIDFVIISVDREGGLAIGSRRMALPSRRYFFSTQPEMNRPGSRVSCDVLVVGPRRCLVSCSGYDLDLTQREMSYTAIADLRDKYHSGDRLDCIVKEYERRKNHLAISVKETVPNPFDGADFRHPAGSRRYAVIAGKYAGGVFCNLPDGVTVMCNYAFHYDDSTFRAGDRVLLVIQRYDMGKKQTYGKVVAKV